MPVGKNSISRLEKSAPKKRTSGIVTNAPEVPAGDAAPAVKPAKTKAAAPAVKAAVAVKSKAAGISLGEELPYYLL